MSATTALDDIWQAMAHLRREYQVPVAVIVGRHAWADLVQQMVAIPSIIRPLLAYGDLSVFGLPLSIEDRRHPDFLAIKCAGGGIVPVAECAVK